MDEQSVLRFLTLAVAVVISLPAHELAHAYSAYRLGDDTAKKAGRLTLNPFAHLDIFGTLALFVFGFGWARPVPVDPGKLKKPRRDMALISFAGPLMNVFIAFVLMIVVKILLAFAGGNSQMAYVFIDVLYSVLWINISLAVFNLLPVPPLDGSEILGSLFPWKIRVKLRKFEKYFYIALILALYLGFLQAPLNFLTDYLFQGLDWLSSPVDFLLGQIR